jgi:hypothetical protein
MVLGGDRLDAGYFMGRDLAGVSGTRPMSLGPSMRSPPNLREDLLSHPCGERNRG